VTLLNETTTLKKNAKKDDPRARGGMCNKFPVIE